MRLIFIRHAEPDYDIDGLTPKGEREAGFLSERVATWKVDHFYSSPLGRAKATAPTQKLPVQRLCRRYWTAAPSGSSEQRA